MAITADLSKLLDKDYEDQKYAAARTTPNSPPGRPRAE